MNVRLVGGHAGDCLVYIPADRPAGRTDDVILGRVFRSLGPTVWRSTCGRCDVVFDRRTRGLCVGALSHHYDENHAPATKEV